MDRARALTALSALANEARLDLVRLLMPQGDEGMAAGDIGRALGLSASRLSFHLAALEQAGLLRSRKQARHVFYSVDTSGMGGTIGYLLNHCCHGHPTVRACCTSQDHASRIAPAVSSPLVS
jgi:ArsR family transcriptional regulator